MQLYNVYIEVQCTVKKLKNNKVAGEDEVKET